MSCSVEPSGNGPFVRDSRSIRQVLSNQSSDIEVLTHNVEDLNSTFAYLGVPAASRDTHVDFTATTFAMRTSCQPITQSCNMGFRNFTDNLTNSSIYGVTFNCSNTNMVDDGTFWILGRSSMFYPDPHMGMANETLWGTAGLDNPFGIATAYYVERSAEPSSPLADDPDMFSNEYYIGAVLFCTVELFDAEYDLVQGNVTRFEVHSSNISAANAFAITSLASDYFNEYLTISAETAAELAVSAQDFADQYAVSYSKINIAGGVNSVQRTPVLVAQQRADILVARVPKAPLFLLLSVNTLFILLGLILTAMAAFTSREASEVRSRLTIEGVVTNLFEREAARELAEVAEQGLGKRQGQETVRVGVDRTSKGGFAFKAFQRYSRVSMDSLTDMKRDHQDVIGLPSLVAQRRDCGETVEVVHSKNPHESRENTRVGWI